MIKSFLAERRIKKFLILMPQTLANDYGHSSEYTEGQVKTALKKLGYKSNLMDMAVAIFCNEEVSKAFGVEKALIKKYRGYASKHNLNFSGVDDGSWGAGSGSAE